MCQTKKRKQNMNTEHEHQRERNVKIEQLNFGQFLCHQLNTQKHTKNTTFNYNFLQFFQCIMYCTR